MPEKICILEKIRKCYK